MRNVTESSFQRYRTRGHCGRIHTVKKRLGYCSAAYRQATYRERQAEEQARSQARVALGDVLVAIANTRKRLERN